MQRYEMFWYFEGDVIETGTGYLFTYSEQIINYFTERTDSSAEVMWRLLKY